MLEIISLDRSERWNAVVRSMCDYDFYFLAEYHRLDTSGTPFLLHYQNRGDSLALPLIIRDIENSDYKDATSVYGYGGPLADTPCPAPESITGFQQALAQFFDSNRIVSAFSRFHALFPYQQTLLQGMGTISEVNHTIGIDLTLSEKEQKSQYVRSLKWNINKLKRKGVTVQKAVSKEEIDAFIEIYYETMNRVNAVRMYYFSKEFFYRFLSSIDSFILLAFYEGQVISGSLCTVCHGIMQAHLSATKSDFLYLSPLKLVWDEARLSGIRQKLHVFHLGGGFHKDKDSLYTFKSQFSKQQNSFKVWKYIHNQEIYDSLVLQKFGNETPEESFFPLYRKISVYTEKFIPLCII